MFFRLKSAEEQKKIIEAGRITAEILSMVIEKVDVGISTMELDSFAYDQVIKSNCIPAFKDYHGFKHTLCTSVNKELVHGVPNDKPLEDGDIISVDLGVNYKGYFGDSAVTLPVGEVDEKTLDLLDRTQQSLYAGISQAKVGNRLGAISNAIWEARENYNVITEFGGHGIGDILHDAPFVFNQAAQDSGIRLREGMGLAIEPMLVDGCTDYETDSEDKWTVRVKHLCAHFEHTLIITNDGPYITTLREDENFTL
jgi:methionyl aminopeptidase